TLVAVPTDLPAGAAAGPLADRLKTDRPTWQPLFDELAASRRATIASVDRARYWVASERRKAFEAVFSEAVFHTAAVGAAEAGLACRDGAAQQRSPMPGLPSRALEADISPIDARTTMAQGWMTH